MDHVAIMRKSWGLTKKILSGEKKIESRWYKFKRSPWGGIGSGDTIYFKDSGEPVTIKAKVSKVLQFSELTSRKVMDILEKYGRGDGLKEKDVAKYYKMFRDRKYCLLIFLKDPVRVEPFNINKKGFGTMASWIRVKNIKEIVL